MTQIYFKKQKKVDLFFSKSIKNILELRYCVFIRRKMFTRLCDIPFWCSGLYIRLLRKRSQVRFSHCTNICVHEHVCLGLDLSMFNTDYSNPLCTIIYSILSCMSFIHHYSLTLGCYYTN
jgi:hypothetical protein